MERKLYVHHTMSVNKGFAGGVLINDYPLLKTFWPVGVVKNAKRVFQDNIYKALTNPDTAEQVLLIMADVWRKTDHQKYWSTVWIRSRTRVSQNFMLGFKDFLEENLMEFSHRFVDTKSVEAINSKGSSWVDIPDTWDESSDGVVIPPVGEVAELTPFQEETAFISGKFEG